jgi:hypothetical protein
MKRIILFVLAVGLYGQVAPLVINPGDPKCTGIVQNDPAWSTDVVFQTVQVAQRMTCKITIKPGLYNVVIRSQEPITTAFVGMRVFNVMVNGQTIDRIDLFKIVGPQTPYEMDILVTAQTQLIISFEATNRTALWSQIIIQPNGQ